MDEESQRVKGVIGEVGLERNDDRFNTFNLTLNMIVDSGKPLTFEQAEALMNRFRKELLGKNVEIAAIIFACPNCGKEFNTEQGMKQHLRRIHGQPKKATKRKTQPKKSIRKRTTSKKKGGKK